MASKVCLICKEDKPLSEYYQRGDTGKYRTTCKKCVISGKKQNRHLRTSKVCKHCGEDKPLDQYQKAGGGKWLQPYCKPCDAKRKQKYGEANKEKIKQKSRERYLKNVQRKPKPSQEELDRLKQEKLKRSKELKLKRLERQRLKKKNLSTEQKLAIKKYMQEWREKNRDNIKKKRDQNRDKLRERKRNYCNLKSATDPQFKILKNLRSRIRFALRRDGAVKSDTTEGLLGCSLVYFRKYFESLFKDGMTWKDYMSGRIHIDHIIPCVMFDLSKEDEQRKCFHYTNLQPLWAEDNLKKSTKIVNVLQAA